MTEHSAPTFSSGPVGPLMMIALPKQANRLDGKVIRWLKQEGEMITAGEPLVEVETKEGAFIILASQNGKLWRISKAQEEIVPVGTHLGWELPAVPPQNRFLTKERLLILFFMVAFSIGGVLLVLDYFKQLPR